MMAKWWKMVDERKGRLRERKGFKDGEEREGFERGLKACAREREKGGGGWKHIRGKRDRGESGRGWIGEGEGLKGSLRENFV